MFTCEDEYDHIPNMIILVHGILKLILHSFSCMLLLFQLGIYYSILNIFILFYHYFYYLFGLILIFNTVFLTNFGFPQFDVCFMKHYIRFLLLENQKQI